MAFAAFAAACTLSVAGCALTRDFPAGPTDAQVEATVRARLDRQWGYSGLQGIVERPAFEPKPIVTQREWGRLMLACMDRAGVGQWGYNEGSGLFTEGSRPSASDQLAFYWCFAEYPTVDLLTTEQIDFIYDYYARWLIPCLEMNGYNVMNAPSRDDFAHADPSIPRWNPYRSLETYPRTPESVDDLVARCSPTVPGIAGWSEQ